MRVWVIHHAADAEVAAALVDALPARGFEPAEGPAGSELALVVASAIALREGLGEAPRRALGAGIPVHTVLFGEDVVPYGFPVAKKHLARARDVEGLLAALASVERGRASKIADSKSDLLGYGVLLAMLARG